MATCRHFVLNHFMRDEPYNNVSLPEKHNLHQHSKRSFDSSTNVPTNTFTLPVLALSLSSTMFFIDFMLFLGTIYIMYFYFPKLLEPFWSHLDSNTSIVFFHLFVITILMKLKVSSVRHIGIYRNLRTPNISKCNG